ncbi:helix-turn-helix domain-containing protein [Haploplasma axanthum]|uniref:HTH-type transcriptional regulator immR n=1 Tax=Haploplasma axanthum TaxID=29552 RepID=A0A449BDS4_HAPAX|nr:helix-turn-helix transcriptional regulator [Haploplasma axanthum]VEU80582.1 HTH-type transcriptional regulator immR [Haploplasma axanthum]
MDTHDVGEYLKALRKTKGYTQEEVADLLYVSNKTISKWERGEGLPEIQTLIAVAELYDVTVDEILIGTNNTKKGKEKLLLRKEYLNNKYLQNFKITSLISLACLIVGLILTIFISSASYNSMLGIGIGLAFVIVGFVILVIGRIKNINQNLEPSSKKNIDVITFRVLILGLISFMFILPFFAGSENSVVTSERYFTILLQYWIFPFSIVLSLIFLFSWIKGYLVKKIKLNLIYIIIIPILVFIPFITHSIVPSKKIDVIEKSNLSGNEATEWIAFSEIRNGFQTIVSDDYYEMTIDNIEYKILISRYNKMNKEVKVLDFISYDKQNQTVNLRYTGYINSKYITNKRYFTVYGISLVLYFGSYYFIRKKINN